MSKKDQEVKDTSEEVELNDDQLKQESEEAEAFTEEQEIDPEKKLADQIEDEKNKYLRLYAEFENFRRRNAKERIELIGTASSDLLKDILPILDDFQRAIDSNKTIEDIEAVKEGFHLLYQKMLKTLEFKGLKSIESKGEMFDAEIHEAIAQMPVDKAGEKGKIIDEVEKGYSLNDKIIRHPKVVVGS
jgi:molecular chaperone GrpE